MSIFNHELDKKLKEEIERYNEAYSDLNSVGSSLYSNRALATYLLDDITLLINSIAKHPKNFDVTLEEVKIEKEKYISASDFAKKELEDAKKSAMGVAGGAAGGLAVASLAPTTAMWVATTFGTASTGTAISALSGAAATNAALAWLGGGTLVAGGGGMAGGTAFLALAGPVGWGIAGASILASVLIFVKKHIDSDKKKQEEIEFVIDNIVKVNKYKVVIDDLNVKCKKMTEELQEIYWQLENLRNKDYNKINKDSQYKLGTMVNDAKVLACIISQTFNNEK